MPTLTLLFTLVLTDIVCILMGCGTPTMANYLIMVTVAARILVLLEVEPLVARFFVFSSGVLADTTPPVALAAYAAAGIANANPFKADNTAFRLGIGRYWCPSYSCSRHRCLSSSRISRGRAFCRRPAAHFSVLPRCRRRFRHIFCDRLGCLRARH